MSTPAHWQPWNVVWQPLERDTPTTQSWTPDQAVIRVLPAGYADIRRESAESTLHLPRRPGQDELLHPYLGSTAAIAAHWAGGTSFHAGCFVHDDGVWAILGDREDGKSSALAAMHARDCGVFADDLLVAYDGIACAGPRCLDLRESGHQHFGIGRDIGVVGTRQRWRVDLPAVPAELPVHGFVTLRWAPEVSTRRCSAAERFAVLARHRAVALTEPDPTAWVPLLGLPMVELSRPKDWSRADAATDALLAAIA